MKSIENVRSAVHESLYKILDTSEVAIKDDETFEDYGVDSLDRMNLLLELEQKLGMELGELDLEKVNTINLLFEHINQL